MALYLDEDGTFLCTARLECLTMYFRTLAVYRNTLRNIRFTVVVFGEVLDGGGECESLVAITH